ncbi:hypothetical protein ISJ10_14045 [Burkholderia pseudomallei]|uniref:DUF6471 domain-containing protein n=1 Tax=Burkholderia orbicola (strain AU 1054) TaxID=331271 RepID=A0A0H2XSV4_BURO1|nr:MULTISPECIES: DUF6471 domain-containing protein [Burkholderia]ABK06969.1 conserved hypothetical protein [Burkholderia cenocepacia HI2424]KNA33554.1 hypothetical protein ADU20_14265 [Burkholderia pseudomallei]MBF4061177.1 hypothetical protein [Burkholderia pseudomallei]MBF4081347.1 hypothetical protein [Burkholderia pseudomallei]MBJ9879149.1 hypothetical protein [Burkholderia cenocepacia]
MSVQFQVKLASGAENGWAKLASRAARVVLARQDMSYTELAGELAKLGVAESAHAVEAKVSRGTFRFAFFLQLIAGSRTDCPYLWADALSSTETWQARSSTVFAAEMAGQPWLNWQMLSNRLQEIGVSLPSESLQAQIESGSFATTLFLQCATVCRFESIYRFLDTSELHRVALANSPQS